MAVWGGLKNRCEKKGSEKQRKKGKIYPFECRVPKNSKERLESLPQWSMQRNRGKQQTRDLFKKIRDTKGTFHAKMGLIKDRNCVDLTEAEDIKKRWQEYTEELYKKDLHDRDNHDGTITHLEPDILECCRGYSTERERQWNFPQQSWGVLRKSEPAVRQPSPSVSKRQSDATGVLSKQFHFIVVSSWFT